MTQQPWGQPAPVQQFPQPDPWGQQAPAQPGYAQQAPAQPPGDGFAFNSAAPATGGGENPRIAQLEGRLVLIRPLSYDPMAQGFGSNPPGPQIIADCLVLDGPPITGALNGQTNQITPFTDGPRSVPFYVSTLYLRQKAVISQLENHVPSRPMLLNRIGKGVARGSNSAPFLLLEATPEDNAAAAGVAAMVGATSVQELWDKVKAASAPAPAPAPVAFGGAGAPQGYPQAVQNQQPPAPAQPWGQQATAQQPPPAAYPQQGPPAAPWQQPAQAPWPQQ